jgi:RND family efflux transporter MFP subunit
MPSADQPTPHRNRWVLGALAVVLALGALVWWQARTSAATEVGVETAAVGPVTRILAVNGKMAALGSVQIRSAVSGTVQEVLVAEGDPVFKGAVLVRLDASQQEAIVTQARSALAQGRIKQAQAVAIYARNRDLGGLIARSQLEDAKLALEGAAQEVGRLQAMLDQATIQRARFTVTAPISGTVVTRTLDPGQLVDPTTALFTLADLSTLIVEADVDEAYAAEIRKGQTAELQLVGQRQTLAGALVFVSPRVDPATGGLAIKIGFDAPVKAPLGLTVTANILVDEQQAITVPRTALTGEALFRLVNGRAVLTPVTMIDWPAARLIVTQGLAPGDMVITDSTGLADGQAVTGSAAPEGP